ncbi:MAG: hypothetical protein J7L54_01385, partial [Elusimicrobia bacterium]|nr:hypothetical protein [Elusimicrobiota bacterium]
FFAADCGFAPLRRLAEKALLSLRKKFYLKKENYLADFIFPDGRRNGLLRPNQIIAAALLRDFFKKSEIRNIVKAVKSKLFTPVGLRTLAPGSPGYKKVYWGNLKRRDSAYHQGTVWPWLFMFFYQLVEPDRKFFVDVWAKHLNEAGMGCFSEIFDAEKPYFARGCVHQAWTVAALLYVSFFHGWIRKR